MKFFKKIVKTSGPSGEKPHQCYICCKRFSDASTLKKHLLAHSGKKSHQCNICGKTFTLSGHLKQHLLKHSGEKPHQCPICSKCFTRSSNLTRHQLIHSGEKFTHASHSQQPKSTSGFYMRQNLLTSQQFKEKSPCSQW